MDTKEFNQSIIDEFRANDGVVGGPFEGAKLLLLHTTGARSGEPRINPLAYTTDGDDLIIIASFAGADKHPPWYHNLVANPAVEVEVGAERFAATAVTLEESRRGELYAQMESEMSAFTEYREKTDRAIPVVALRC